MRENKSLSKMTYADLKAYIKSQQNRLSRQRRKGINVSITLSTKGKTTRAELLKEASKAKKQYIADVKARQKSNNVTKPKKSNKVTKPKSTPLDMINKRTLEQFNKLGKSTLQKEVSYLSKEVEKRIKELEKQGLKSTPVSKFLSGGKIGDYDKNDLKSLRTEYMRLRSFLLDKRTTVQGEKIHREKIKAGLFGSGVLLKDKIFDEFFEIYDKAEELFNQAFDNSYKYELMKYTSFLLENNKGETDINDLAQSVRSYAERLYKQKTVEEFDELEQQRQELFEQINYRE